MGNKTKKDELPSKLMTNSSQKVSLVIVNYNGRQYLEDCMDSIKKSSYSFEMIDTIVVDNASSDKSVDFIKTDYPWVKIIELDKNYGFAKANNIGAENARGDYIVFLNNDTVVAENWLYPLINDMESDRTVGAASGKILFYDNKKKVNSAGVQITFLGGGYDMGFLDNDSSKYDIQGQRASVCAAAMIVRKDEFLQLGGFDEDYFMYFEDVDLCWRYWLYGKKVEYVPDSIIYHKFGGSSGAHRHAPLRVFYGTRNALFNIIKNYEIYNIPFPIVFSFLYHILKALYFIVRLNFSLALSMVKAYCSFLRYLPKTIVKRKKIQSNRKIKDKYLFNNSIIASFYMTFREFLRLLKVASL